MTTENVAVFFFLAKMGSRKKVHAFVRVRPTDDFAHEMIKYGDDNKVSAVVFAFTCLRISHCFLTALFSDNLVRTRTELVKVQMESRVLQVQSAPPTSAVNEEAHETPIFIAFLVSSLPLPLYLTLEGDICPHS